MNAKSKVISLLVAFVLMFGMFGGAVANDVEPVSVDLADSTQLCFVDIYPNPWGAGTFGTWEYDPNLMEYFRTSGTSTMSLWVYVFTPTWKGCDVTMSFGGLSNGVDLIGTENFSAVDMYQNWGASVGPDSWFYTGVGAGPWPFDWADFDMTLDTVPMVPPGHYTGNINVTVSNTL